MASDQKCVSGEGAPRLSKYDRPRKTYHQFWNQNSDGMISGRILVSSARLNSTHSAATTNTTTKIAGNSRRTRRSQNLGRLIVLLSRYSLTRMPVIR